MHTGGHQKWSGLTNQQQRGHFPGFERGSRHSAAASDQYASLFDARYAATQKELSGT